MTAVSGTSRARHGAMHLVRGGLIGLAEIVPGVSGGTIALITGVYDALIGSAGHVVRGAAHAVGGVVRRRGLAAARGEFAQVRWAVIAPVLVGMVLAVVVGAAVLAPLVESRPVETRAVFSGLIVASLAVPIGMIGRAWRWWHVAAALAAAVAAFVLTGIPASDAAADPPLPIVALAAAVAVCALVLPGVSGSFLLVAVGLYAPTLAAVNDRDFAYLGVFALGAATGLALFVSGLQWLLEHRRVITLAVMTGLMAGSLRALWPWQNDTGELLAPGADAGTVALLAIGGAAIVTVLLVGERIVGRRAADASDASRH